MVLTLSGVLKDIMLVCASLLIFGDPVSGVQVFGYGIALFGLVYYKVGPEKLKEYLFTGHRRWNEYGQRNPAMKRLIFTAMIIFGLIVILGGAFPFVPPEYKEQITKYNPMGPPQKATDPAPGGFGG